jgi:SAM-dependent methyltransferase
MSLREEVAPDLGHEPSFSSLFAHALRGVPCRVVGLGETPTVLPVHEWTRKADAVDDALLAHCRGATLDVGCGPGRLAARLAAVGHTVLGLDVVREAVEQTRARGVWAVEASVFDRLPDEGHWESALLADGNIGIGGDPGALLRRLAAVVSTGGRVVVEVKGPGVPTSTSWARLEIGETRSRPFRWSVVGVDAIADLARAAGLVVLSSAPLGSGRWVAVLERSW